MDSVGFSVPFRTVKYTYSTFADTLHGKSHFCIPFRGIARPQSQFPHSCVCERFIYSHIANEEAAKILYKCLVPIFVFPEMNLLFPKQDCNVLSPEFLHSYICEKFYLFPGSVCLFCCREKQYVDQSWEYIDRSQTHECGNWD